MTRTTGPVLALAPGTRTAPGTGANTGPSSRPPGAAPKFTCPPRISSQLISEPAFAALHHAGY